RRHTRSTRDWSSDVCSSDLDLFDPELSDEQRRARIEQAGLVLEKRKRQFEEWEKSSPQFIGHDEYYTQEVDRTQLLGRFISAEDLVRFVADFLIHFDRRLALVSE